MTQLLPIRLLAAIDYSKQSELVVAQTIELAGRYGSAEAHFIHVSDAVPNELGIGARRTEKLLAYLSDQLKAGALENGAPLTEHIKIVGHEATGNPADVIVRTAGDLLADLVLVGQSGRTGVERLLTTSVAESVLRHAACPVLVVRPKTHDNPAAQIAPPCPLCLETRRATRGVEWWCEQHQERHGRRHTYYGQHRSNTANPRWLS
jgi:nucleotide-binding universal stress UspA family protein